jgi:hypothetical protein
VKQNKNKVKDVRVKLSLQKSSFSPATALENYCLMRADNHPIGNPKRKV